MAKAKDTDTLTPEELAERAELAAVPVSPLKGGAEPQLTWRVPKPGMAAALAAVCKGRGGGPSAETMVLWTKEADRKGGTVLFTSNRGRDVALLMNRLSDEGVASVILPVAPDGVFKVQVRTECFRSVSHAFRPSGDRVEFDADRDIDGPARILAALRDLPGEPADPSHTGDRWLGWQRPLPGLAARLVEIYRGKGGGPDAESAICWSKGSDVVTFTSDRGKDVAALARRVGDSGIVAFRVPTRADWPIFLRIDERLFRTAAHAFRSPRKGDEDDDTDV